MMETYSHCPRPVRMTTTHDQTYTTREAAAAAGVTYRMLDYWLRVGVVRPQTEPQPGSGHPRRFTADEVQALIEVVTIYRSARAILRDMNNGVLWETARGKEPFHEPA